MARKGHSAAMVTLKAVIVTAPAELREQFDGLTDKSLLERCAGLRPGAIDTTTASMKHALRSLAKQWFVLDGEIPARDRVLDVLTSRQAPTLRDGFADSRPTGPTRVRPPDAAYAADGALARVVRSSPVRRDGGPSWLRTCRCR
jgi:transposase